MAHDGDKTEQPTEKRLRDAHAEGQFARSNEINVVFVFIAAMGAMVFTMREQVVHIVEISVNIFSHLGQYHITPDSIAEWSRLTVGTIFRLVLPLGVMCAAAAALAGGLQSQFRLASKALEPKLSRIDPGAGFKRIFSPQGWLKLGSEAFKLAVVGFVVWGAVKSILVDPLFYMPVSLMRLGGFFEQTFSTLMTRFIFALGAIAAANYIYQLRKVNHDLMMSKQEIKEEFRSTEGDPIVRSARRAMARRLLQKQMLSAVPNADVVVTNPTHYAVALRYERGLDKAPIVLAKGMQMFAQRIKAIAIENEVPMVENRPVARMLYKYGRVGKAIPVDLYKTVAEILAFVYKTHRYYFYNLKNRRAAAAAAEHRRATASPARQA
jgi:flagellar biosynthesis protein FlhB